MWKAVRLTLKSANLPDARWGLVLADCPPPHRITYVPQLIQLDMRDILPFSVAHYKTCPSRLEPGQVLLR